MPKDNKHNKPAPKYIKEQEACPRDCEACCWCLKLGHDVINSELIWHGMVWARPPASLRHREWERERKRLISTNQLRLGGECGHMDLSERECHILPQDY